MGQLFNRSKKQLEAIHIEAARTITGATKLCSINRLLDELGWESLQNRRNKHKLIIFYKIMNGLTPNYLSDLLPPLVHETTTYNLRNVNHIQTVYANTNLYFNSVIPLPSELGILFLMISNRPYPSPPSNTD